jgi:hypothetical protein
MRKAKINFLSNQRQALLSPAPFTFCFKQKVIEGNSRLKKNSHVRFSFTF